VRFTLDQLAVLNQADPKGILTGRLNLQHTGVLESRLAGSSAARPAGWILVYKPACLWMPYARGCGPVGLKRPAMWITRDAETMRLERQRAGGWSEVEIRAHQSTMRAVYESLPGNGYFVQVPGIFHADFTDIPSWSPITSWLGYAGPIGAERAHRIINACSLAFFDRHLKAQPGTRFDELVGQYPEVLLEKRQP